MVVTLLIILTLFSTLFIFAVSRGKLRDRNGYIMALGLLGTAFMFYNAPTWRFGLGYLLVVPSLAVSVIQNRFNLRWQHSSGTMRQVVAASLIGILVLFILPSSLILRYSHAMIDKTLQEYPRERPNEIPFNILIPPGTWNMEYDMDKDTDDIVAYPMILKKEQIGDISYYRSSDGETCWDAPLPCAPHILHGVKLRYPAKGIAGGFVRTTP